MDSFRGNCEIVTAKDEPSTTSQPQTFCHVSRASDREQKPPFMKKESSNSLEDDINKLFEAFNLRASKSLDLSDLRRNPSKMPMRVSSSHSPGFGFSQPVTLKQALRGLCISQAVEMAAMKRLSVLAASPRMSEAERITNLYQSVVVEAVGGLSRTKLEDDMSSSSNMGPRVLQDSLVMLPFQSSCPSPTSCVRPIIKDMEYISSDSGQSMSKTATSSNEAKLLDQVKGADYSLVHGNIAPASEADIQLLETVCSVDEQHSSVSVLPHQKACTNLSEVDKKIYSSNNVASDPCMNSGTLLKGVNETAPKLKPKSKLQTVPLTCAVKNNRRVKLKRATSLIVKTVTRNKNFVIKKPKKVVVSTYEVTSSLTHDSGQLICQKCRCSLKDPSKDPFEIRGAPIVKMNSISKFNEKRDISQSSKSSIRDLSSSTSTTSLSEESNLNESTCGNRPHMSKDMRWEAINNVRKHCLLGLSHFNLLKKLGSGDIGTVYLAELIGTGCLYAIKVMDNEFLARRKKLPRSHMEREILRMLDHPFLATLFAQFTSDSLSCLVMEFCPGGDLHVLRQQQPGRYFPEPAARFYVAEVLLALEYLHMLGIVYRDLKPENILVRKDGHIMLTDFDLALRCSVSPTLVKSVGMKEPPRFSGPCAGSNCIDPFCGGPSCKMSCFSRGFHFMPSTARSTKLKTDASEARSSPQLVVEPTEARSNSFVGTHEYLAPEIIKGEGHGSAVDWWTFGIFLYELLYGMTPFKGAGNEETLANVMLQKLEFPDTPIVSFQARDLIRRLLVKEPENRIGTETGAAEIKRHPFFEGLNWALIRSAIPPNIPEFCDIEYLETSSLGADGKH